MNNKFLEKTQMIFLVESMGLQNNGIVESVLRKVKFIEDAWGHRPIILTSDHNVHLFMLSIMFSRGEKAENQTSINDDTIVFGVFDYIQSLNQAEKNIEVRHHLQKADKDLRYVEILNNVYEVYDGETLVKKEDFTAPGNRLYTVEFYNSGGRMIRKEFYDYFGRLTREIYYDPDNPEYHPRILYYASDNRICIQADYNYIEEPEKSMIRYNKIYKNNNELASYTMFDDEGKTAGTLDTHEELIALCLDSLTNDPDINYMIFDECNIYNATATLLKKPNVAAAAVFHNIFLENPYDLNSNPQTFYTFLCENRMRFDAVISLTKESTRDYAHKYGFSENLFTIGHPYPFAVKKADFNKRDHKKAVILARLHWQKKLEDALDIFNEVIKEVPDARLDIFGTGQEQENLQSKIDELGMGDNVTLKGYTDKAAEELSGSACFLMTSVAEGLPLTLLESVSNGCPVFSYDVKYGPATVVKNGETGYLFAMYDKNSFAQTLINYFNDISLQEKFSENCYKDASRFSVEVFLKKWREMMEIINERMERKKQGIPTPIYFYELAGLLEPILMVEKPLKVLEISMYGISGCRYGRLALESLTRAWGAGANVIIDRIDIEESLIENTPPYRNILPMEYLDRPEELENYDMILTADLFERLNEGMARELLGKLCRKSFKPMLIIAPEAIPVDEVFNIKNIEFKSAVVETAHENIRLINVSRKRGAV